MKILEIKELDSPIKSILMRLWNEEYPTTLGMANVSDFEYYLENIAPSNHFLLYQQSEVAGWVAEFTRAGETWFAMIIRRDFQQMGFGQLGLEHLKSRNKSLNGWVVDNDSYARIDGSLYLSPVSFYKKNGFEVQKDIRLETETLSAIKITWTKLN
ncbi:MAG: GNAT superfamily N-acetyltransferase [Bacteroidia bacterium]|jgi:GNAT superfamily N-acetyltransferase